MLEVFSLIEGHLHFEYEVLRLQESKRLLEKQVYDALDFYHFTHKPVVDGGLVTSVSNLSAGFQLIHNSSVRFGSERVLVRHKLDVSDYPPRSGFLGLFGRRKEQGCSAIWDYARSMGRYLVLEGCAEHVSVLFDEYEKCICMVFFKLSS